MNKLIWYWLPSFIHEMVLKVTGYRLVKIASIGPDFTVGTFRWKWSKTYPL